MKVDGIIRNGSVFDFAKGKTGFLCKYNWNMLCFIVSADFLYMCLAKICHFYDINLNSSSQRAMMSCSALDGRTETVQVIGWSKDSQRHESVAMVLNLTTIIEH